ncbi:hypothetical protein G7054_g6541 [Neopestalotiopsis clavispora]|nr:hypothetical protein G7054_g6541 [Neopestalotiopsis clavispora]
MRLINTKHFLDKNEIAFQDRDSICDEPYAILSHTWGRQLKEEADGTLVWGGEDDEILFADVGKTDTSEKKPDAWKKIQKACQAAQQQQCNYLWVDTCCFNKESSAELDESINAMFAWYQQSKVCLVYLADLEVDSVQVQEDDEKQCRWFKRGWTLQELIAPKKVDFYNRDWKKVGSRDKLVDILHEITEIDCEALTGEVSCLSFTVAQRMKWAACRDTKRPEDRAYSLLGLFGVQMSLIYGIGAKAAFHRLQKEIIQTTTDMTVFAWNPSKSSDDSPDRSSQEDGPFSSMLADSPDQFEESPEMKSMELEGHFSITNRGVSLDASTLRIVPKGTQEYKHESIQESNHESNQQSRQELNAQTRHPLVFLIGYTDKHDHMICFGVYLQKIGSANYARCGGYDLAMFKEDKKIYALKPVPRHQCYITISRQEAQSSLDKSHRRAIAVQEKYNSKSSEPKWSMKVLDQIPERIWDYQKRVFFRVGYGDRDVVRAVHVVLRLLHQEVTFAVMLHRYEEKDKVFILDEKNPKWSVVKPIFGPSQRFDSVKWDDLGIDLAVQSEYLDVVAQGRSYRVSASLKELQNGKKELTLDVASDAYQQIETLEQKLKRLEGLEQRLGGLEGLEQRLGEMERQLNLERQVNGKRGLSSVGDALEEDASKKHKGNQ